VLTIVIVMAAILLICAVVLTYVAFPHRGEQVPAAPWLGDAMTKAVDAVPTLHEEAGDPAPRR
jgi:hypothetical protein